MATFAAREPDGSCGQLYSGTKGSKDGARLGGEGRRWQRLGVHFINKHKRCIFRKITTLSDESEAGNYANSHLPHEGLDGIIK